jgi:hypothetical protein
VEGPKSSDSTKGSRESEPTTPATAVSSNQSDELAGTGDFLDNLTNGGGAGEAAAAGTPGSKPWGAETPSLIPKHDEEPPHQIFKQASGGVDKGREPSGERRTFLEDGRTDDAATKKALMSRNLNISWDSASDSETEGAVKVGATGQYQCY